jgi:predicted Holliday junction resolvase-like endonuclease
MSEYIILVVIGIVAVLPAVFTVLHVRHKREIERKNRGLIRQLHEQDCLAKELEHAQVKNETLEQLLKNMLEVSHKPAVRPATDVRRGKQGRRKAPCP